VKVSLRARLLLALAAVALVGLVVADLATYAAFRSILIDRVDHRLVAAHKRLIPPIRTLGESEPAVLATAAPGAFVELRGPAGTVLLRGPKGGRFSHEKPRLPSRIGGLESPLEPGVAFFTVDSSPHGSSEFRVRAQRFTDGSLLMAALPLDDVDSTLDRLAVIEVVVTAAVLLGAVGVGWWLVRVALRPLRSIETTAASIASGELSARVPQRNERTEVGRLAMALNAMLQRIEDAFTKQQTSEERLRRFVADASHELRTPVSAVGAYAELFERGAQ
jgi:two-component system OmpR family sensor kinase